MSKSKSKSKRLVQLSVQLSVQCLNSYNMPDKLEIIKNVYSLYQLSVRQSFCHYPEGGETSAYTNLTFE